MQHKKDIATAKKKLQRDIQASKSQVRKARSEVAKFERQLATLEKKKADNQMRKSVETHKYEELIDKVSKTHGDVSVNALKKKFEDLGAAEALLEYLERAQKLVDKGILLPRDPQAEADVVQAGRWHALTGQGEADAHPLSMSAVEVESPGEPNPDVLVLLDEVGKLRMENIELRQQLELATGTVRVQDQRIDTLRGRLQSATTMSIQQKFGNIERVANTDSRDAVQTGAPLESSDLGITIASHASSAGYDNSIGQRSVESVSLAAARFPDDIFERIDTNRDGTVSRTEFRKAVKSGLLTRGDGSVITPLCQHFDDCGNIIEDQSATSNGLHREEAAALRTLFTTTAPPNGSHDFTRSISCKSGRASPSYPSGVVGPYTSSQLAYPSTVSGEYRNGAARSSSVPRTRQTMPGVKVLPGPSCMDVYNRMTGSLSATPLVGYASASGGAAPQSMVRHGFASSGYTPPTRIASNALSAPSAAVPPSRYSSARRARSASTRSESVFYPAAAAGTSSAFSPRWVAQPPPGAARAPQELEHTGPPGFLAHSVLEWAHTGSKWVHAGSHGPGPGPYAKAIGWQIVRGTKWIHSGVRGQDQ